MHRGRGEAGFATAAEARSADTGCEVGAGARRGTAWRDEDVRRLDFVGGADVTEQKLGRLF
jgi:hypothetical protein